MKNQRGFIQIPILIAIIVGVLVLGGGGYFGVKQYKNYQVNKFEKEKKYQEKEKEVQSLAKKQREALKEAQVEIEKLKNKPSQIIIREKTINSSGNDLIALIEQWKPRVAKVACRFDDGSYASYYGVDEIGKSGSGFLILMNYRNDQTGQVDETIYAIATNAHVVLVPPQKNIIIYKSKFEGDYYDIPATSCDISFDGHQTTYRTIAIKNREVLKTPFGLGYIEEYQHYIGDPNGVDFALVKIANPDSYIRQNASNLTSCSNVKLGEKMAVFGFPGIGSDSGITVTEGIISGEEENYFVTSAKIDSGNSGGIAISIDRNCFIGTPTATAVGRTESLGRILKTLSILEKKSILK